MGWEPESVIVIVILDNIDYDVSRAESARSISEQLDEIVEILIVDTVCTCPQNHSHCQRRLSRRR